jgi:HrpA-like RNA helicase
MMNDNFLSKVRGLLIDEAHERSVNTDIVLGKIILKKYSNFVSPNFYF